VPGEGSTTSPDTQIVGSSSSAGVIFPAFGSTGLVGDEASVVAELYINYSGVFEPITVPPGIVTPVYSNGSVIAAGLTTCATLGLAEHKQPGPVMRRQR
jgi:hypothetical protein